jgi:hypothetical protein
MNTIADIVTSPDIHMFINESSCNCNTSGRKKGWFFVGHVVTAASSADALSVDSGTLFSPSSLINGIISHNIIPLLQAGMLS